MRIGKRAHAGWWFCEDRYDNIPPPTMTRTHILLHCPTFEAVRREVWKDPLLVPSPGLDQLAPC
jgi:hypothetical protein